MFCLAIAITRARKRVVVLVRNKIMRDYFQETLKLGLDNAEATIVLKEFEKETSLDEWKEEGRKYFTDERYGLAEVSERVEYISYVQMSRKWL